MTGLVLDASLAMTWCFPDEQDTYAGVLNALEDRSAWVPSLWPLEIANALAVGERRKRLTASDSKRFAALLNELPIEIDSHTTEWALSDTLALARPTTRVDAG